MRSILVAYLATTAFVITLAILVIAHDFRALQHEGAGSQIGTSAKHYTEIGYLFGLIGGSPEEVPVLVRRLETGDVAGARALFDDRRVLLAEGILETLEKFDEAEKD